MSADQASGTSATTGTKEFIPCGLVARPLSELPRELRPKRVEPATADNEYDVLHYMR